MQDLYDILLGRPQAANDDGHGDGAAPPPTWDEADGEGPDRLFNRYRRLRLLALTETAA